MKRCSVGNRLDNSKLQLFLWKDKISFPYFRSVNSQTTSPWESLLPASTKGQLFPNSG